MNVLITGATGFVGSELVHLLLEKGYHVRIFRRETSNLHLLSSVTSEIEHSIGDIGDLDTLRDAMKSIQVVFHVAGNVRFRSQTLNRVNVQGTAAVVNVARESGIERLVHTSSIAAIANPDGSVSDENSEWQNKSLLWPYAKSKYLAELEVQRGVAEGLDAVIVNPSLVFGPDRSNGKALNVTHQYAIQIRAGKMKAYPSGGTNVVDVTDVALGHLAALLHGEPGARYILGSENLTWKSIFAQLSDALNVNPPRIAIPYGLALAGGTLADFWNYVTGQNLGFGRSTVRSILRQRQYSNQRAIQELGCSFRPFSETALRVADSLPT